MMNQEFDNSLEYLGVLYEEGKDCLIEIGDRVYVGHPQYAAYVRLHEILRSMRDLAAVNMQKLHIKSDN